MPGSLYAGSKLNISDLSQSLIETNLKSIVVIWVKVKIL